MPELLRDILATGQVPGWLTALLFAAIVAERLFAAWRAGARDDRRLLSADERTFRRELIARCRAAEERAAAVERRAGLAEANYQACERRHDEDRALVVELRQKIEQLERQLGAALALPKRRVVG